MPGLAGARAPRAHESGPWCDVTLWILRRADILSPLVGSNRPTAEVTNEVSAQSPDSPAAPANNDPLLGTLIDTRYRVVEEIGRGGMGTVYRAADTRLHDRSCAVKVVTGLTGDYEATARFGREVRIISLLTSPNTVRIFDTGQLPDGRPYIVMELLRGLTLSEVLQAEGPLEPVRALRIVDGVLSALVEAHEQGVIHRDLKPSNVILVGSTTSAELPKVLDFGLAKDVTDHAQPLTSNSAALGTPHYMAPEQFDMAQRDNIGPRTDLYAIGVTTYRLLAGRLPFEPSDPVPAELQGMPFAFRLAWLHVNRMPARPFEASRPVWAVLSRLLQKRPDDRYASARDVMVALRQIPELAGILAPLRSSDGPSGERPSLSNVAAVSSPDSTGLPILGESQLNRSHTGEQRRRLPIMAAAAILTVIAGTGAIWYFVGGSPTDTGSDSTRPALATHSPPIPVKICLESLLSHPSGATVLRDGKRLGLTPVSLPRPCDETWQVRFELDHYKALEYTLTGLSADGARSVRLVPIHSDSPSDADVPDAEAAARRPRARTARKGVHHPKGVPVRGSAAGAQRKTPKPADPSVGREPRDGDSPKNRAAPAANPGESPSPPAEKKPRGLIF